MDLWLIITLIVLGSLLFIYLLLMLATLNAVRVFNKRLKDRSSSIRLIFVQKYDIIKLLVDLLKKKKISVPQDVSDGLKHFENPDDSDVGKLESIVILNKTYQSVTYVASLHKNIQGDSDYIALKDTMEEVDVNYRSQIALYNADVSAYNYWINFRLFKYLFNKKKPKETIS